MSDRAQSSEAKIERTKRKSLSTKREGSSLDQRKICHLQNERVKDVKIRRGSSRHISIALKTKKRIRRKNLSFFTEKERKKTKVYQHIIITVEALKAKLRLQNKHSQDKVKYYQSKVRKQREWKQEDVKLVNTQFPSFKRK